MYKQLVYIVTITVLLIVFCLCILPKRVIEHFTHLDDPPKVDISDIYIIPPYLAIPLQRPHSDMWIVNVPVTPFQAPLFPLEKYVETPSYFQYTVLTPWRNQGTCGVCWAFALTNVLGDLLPMKVNLSVENLISCVVPTGCDGASPDTIALICRNKQIRIGLEKNYPYTHDTSSVVQPCPVITTDYATITSVYSISIYQPEIHYHINTINDNIFRMKQVLLQYGSFYAVMTVYNDFFTYSGYPEVYQPAPKSTIVGGHAVEIIGYTPNSWICRSNWAHWPSLSTRQGFFQIKLGSNCCGIESRTGIAFPEWH